MPSASPPAAPAAYGPVDVEYRALREAAGVDVVRPAAILALPGGPDTAGAILGPPLPTAGETTTVAAVDEAGAACTRVTLAGRADGTLLADADRPGLPAALRRAGVPFRDRIGEVARLRVSGPRAEAALGGLAPPLGAAREGVDLGGAARVLVARPAPEVVLVWAVLGDVARVRARLQAGGALPVGTAALLTVRVEDGDVEPGDLEPAPRPGEHAAVVEIGGAAPLRGRLLDAAGRDAGRTGPAAPSPRLGGRPVALAAVRGDLAHAGTALVLDAGRVRVPAAVLRPIGPA